MSDIPSLNINNESNNKSDLRKIVSLVPSATEMLFFLGLDLNIAGVTEHCNYPEKAKMKEKVGTFAFPQLEKILSLKPDIVLADKALHRRIINELENKGIKLIYATPSNVEDIFQVMSEIGKACSKEREVKPLIDSLRERTVNLRIHREIKKKRVFRLMNTNPFITPGPESFQYDALQIAGAQLMDFNTKEPYVNVSWHQILEFDPEIIFFCGVNQGQELPRKCKGCTSKNPICHRTADDFLTEDWKQITAVKENRIYPVSCDTLCRPGPRLIDGMEMLRNKHFNF